MDGGLNNKVVCYRHLPTCIRWTAHRDDNDPSGKVRQKEYDGLLKQKQLQDHCPVGRIDRIYRDTSQCIQDFQNIPSNKGKVDLTPLGPPLQEHHHKDKGVCAHIQKLPVTLSKDTRSLKEMLLMVGDAIQCIHNQNVAHGDIKDENVMIDEDNVPRLIDFGLAQSIRDDHTDLIIYDWWRFLIMCMTLHGDLEKFEDTYSTELMDIPQDVDFQELATYVTSSSGVKPLLDSLRDIVLNGRTVNWKTWWTSQMRPQLVCIYDV